MTSAIAYGLIGWGCLVLFSLGLIFVLCRRDPVVPPPDPAFAGPSVADLQLALEHDALIEDVEVAWLESIPVMKWDPEGLA